MFTFAASKRCMIMSLNLGGNFSMPKWSKASDGEGSVGLCVIEEIREKTHLQKELRDLQNQRRCAIVPILPQFLQQVGGELVYIFDNL